MSIHLRGLHPQVREAAETALAWARFYGIAPTVTSGFRSWQEQENLRRRWERGLSRVPANRPGDSAHNYGLAWDSTVPEEHQQAWNVIRRWVGFEVLPNDQIHAQVPGWRRFIPGLSSEGP